MNELIQSIIVSIFSIITYCIFISLYLYLATVVQRHFNFSVEVLMLAGIFLFAVKK
jgi:hypothetical protein